MNEETRTSPHIVRNIYSVGVDAYTHPAPEHCKTFLLSTNFNQKMAACRNKETFNCSAKNFPFPSSSTPTTTPALFLHFISPAASKINYYEVSRERRFCSTWEWCRGIPADRVTAVFEWQMVGWNEVCCWEIPTATLPNKFFKIHVFFIRKFVRGLGLKLS